jgi:hypothetical protein
MKKSMTFVLAASMLTLALAAGPQKAHAAFNAYLNLNTDSAKTADSQSQKTTTDHGFLSFGRWTPSPQ